MRISLLLTKLDPSQDGPWVWQDSWNKDMPPFFQGMLLFCLMFRMMRSHCLSGLQDCPTAFTTTFTKVLTTVQ